MRLSLAPTIFSTLALSWNIAAADSRCLRQSDFDTGTYHITTPGDYKLCSDVFFGPGKPDLSTATDEEIALAFDPAFVAALAVEASDVTLDLNGYTIQQDPLHALLQRRSFTVIELDSDLRNIQIKGPGKVGLSSQHGVYGVNNQGVSIENVDFSDFEIAAVALENVEGLTIKDSRVLQNRRDLPVLASFSVATRILPYVKALKESEADYTMILSGTQTTATEVYANLIISVANVYRDVMSTGFINEDSHPDEFNLFNNPHHITDAHCYAFFVHGDGNSSTSRNVVIENNDIRNVQCFTNEAPSIVINEVVQNDANGAAVQLVNTFNNEWIATDEEMRYTGNVVSNAQIMVAKAIQEGILQNNPALPTHKNSIDPQMIAWAEDPTKTLDPNFRCSGASMYRVMIRVEDTAGFAIKDNTIDNAFVVTSSAIATSDESNVFVPEGAAWKCSSYDFGKSVIDRREQPVGLSGISIVSIGSHQSFDLDIDYSSIIRSNSITNLNSQHAPLIIGIDVQQVLGDVILQDNVVDLADRTGGNPSDPYISCRTWKCDNVVNENNIFIQEPVYLSSDSPLYESTTSLKLR
ncbi:hypothetical protein HJC23_010510, partial [Cyclotella cryptica]